MTAGTWSGVAPATGPLAPAAYVPQRAGFRCECDDTVGESCARCDGTSADEWEAELAARPAAKARKEAMRTPAYRAAWLMTFAEPMRSRMAAAADQQFGPLDVREETAA